MHFNKRLLFPVCILAVLIYALKAYFQESEQNKFSKTEHVGYTISAGSSFGYSSRSSVAALIGSRVNKAKKFTSGIWQDISVNSSELGEISKLINADKSEAAFKFVKINIDFLDEIKEGDIFELAIPDAVAINMHVTSVQLMDKGRAVVGHLSNFSEAYYIGFSYDTLGNIVGEITSEKHNYSIRSFGEKTVVFKVLKDIEKFKHDDF